MAEDALSRYHVPDEAAKIRALAETGVKGRWDKIFHPEESEAPRRGNLPTRKDRLTAGKEGGAGGGEHAIDLLFGKPESVDPELRILFSDFLKDVYGINDKEELWEGLFQERERLEKRYIQFLGAEDLKHSELETIDGILEEIRQVNLMYDGELENKLRLNFLKWINACEGEKVEYDLEGVPQKILRLLERRGLRRQKVALTPDLAKIRNPRIREDMQFWLNAWADPEANLKAFGLKFENGKVVGVALKSDKYGIVGVPFTPWSQALGGQEYSERKNGVTISGVDFGKGHIIAPGEGGENTQETIRTLEISGVSHASLPVVFLRK